MKVTDAMKRLFWGKHPAGSHEMKAKQPTVQSLRIEGTEPAPLTGTPDDAELAAQALLESLVSPNPSRDNDISEAASNNEKQGGKAADQLRDAEYYRRLAERIRQAHDQATLRTMRFVTWCELELEKRDLPIEGKGSLAQMETELYKRIDTIERVGGELKQRWQHCLAEVIIRRMKEGREQETQEENK